MTDPRRPLLLLTGAALRLGRAIALELAEAGWDLALHCRGSHDAAMQARADVQALGARAEVFSADLADPVQVQALLPRVVAAMGEVDALVNNASRFEPDNAHDFGAEAALGHYQVNLVAPLLLSQALHAHLSGRGSRGCVVNLLDQKLWNPNPDYLSYTLSKAALNEATRLLAQAFAPTLRVVGVAPGLTLGSPLIDADKLSQLQAQGPLGYGPQAGDIAQAVRFALSNRALTGSTLLIDGGQHLQPHARDFSYE